MVRLALDIEQEVCGNTNEHTDVLVPSIANQLDPSVAVTLPCVGKKSIQVRERNLKNRVPERVVGTCTQSSGIHPLLTRPLDIKMTP